MNQRRIVFATFLTLVAIPWTIAPPVKAEEPSVAPQIGVRDLIYRVGDSNYRIENTGGRVDSLQVKETVTDVLFAFDKADLLPKAQQTLSRATIMRHKAKGTVRIDGYTDAKGYNQRLSERRAGAVENWFKSNWHFSEVSFAAKGFGAKKDRRVEITITKS